MVEELYKIESSSSKKSNNYVDRVLIVSHMVYSQRELVEPYVEMTVIHASLLANGMEILEEYVSIDL